MYRFGPFSDRAGISFAASVLIVALLAYLVGEGEPLPGSTESIDVLEAIRFGLLDGLMRLISDLGSGAVVGPLLLVVSGGLAFQRRWNELGVAVLGGVLIALGMPEMKDALARPRPTGGLVETGSFAFPSGHAAQSVVYLFLALLWVHIRPGRAAARAVSVASGLALLIGVSRIYLGVHHLDDVIAGWAFGIAAFTAWPVAVAARDRLRHNLR